MDEVRIEGIFEKNLLIETVVTADKTVNVYKRNVRSNVNNLFTFNCNVCKIKDIEGAQALFEHNKSDDHIGNVKKLSVSHYIQKKINELKCVKNCDLAEFSHYTFDSASLATVEQAIKTLNQIYHFYETTPEQHPSYLSNWRAYYQRRRAELSADLVDVENHDFTAEWTAEWDARRNQYYKKSVTEAITYIVNNYTTMNNTAPESEPSTMAPYLESGQSPQTSTKKKRLHGRSKSKKRSKSHRKHRRSVSTRRSSSDRLSPIGRGRRRRDQSESPFVRRHRKSGRSRSHTRRHYSPKRYSPKRYSRRRSSSIEQSRRSRNRSRTRSTSRSHRHFSPRKSLGRRSSSFEHRGRSRTRSKSPGIQRHWPNERSNPRWTSPVHYILGHSDSSSTIVGRRSKSHSDSSGRFPRGPSTTRNDWKSNDLRYKINKRRNQRSMRPRSRSTSQIRGRASPKLSPILSSDRSPSEQRLLKLKESILTDLQKDQIDTRTIYCNSDSGQFSSDAQTLSPVDVVSQSGKGVPFPLVRENKMKTTAPEKPATVTSNALSPKQPMNMGMDDQQIHPSISKPVSFQPVTTNVVPSKQAPSKAAIPAVPPIPPVSAIPPKSILKKAAAPSETLFAKAKRLLSPSNSNVRKFYDKNEQKNVVDASKRILAHASSTKAPTHLVPYINLVLEQMRAMLKHISIELKSLEVAEMEELMKKYVLQMGSDSSAVKSKANKDAQLVKTLTTTAPSTSAVYEAKPPSKMLNNQEKSTKSLSMNTSHPIPGKSSNIDRKTLLNDIDVKPSEEPSSSAAFQPNPRDPRLRANERAKTQKPDPETDCLDAVAMDISYSDTEIESDDDCQYVGIISYGGH